MSIRNKLILTLKNITRKLLPLFFRKYLAKKISLQTWLSSDQRAGWSLELVRDMATLNVNEYHKFLWSNHIGYADTYEVEQRFGTENINESRKLLFDDMIKSLNSLKIDYQNDINSVLDIGCSLGYLLKYMENSLFTNASELHGIDIDAYAIEEGSSYLQAHDSKIKLTCLDMEDIAKHLNNKSYDIVFCAGTLIYLDQNKAINLIENLLQHSNKLLVLTGLASPETDNKNLTQSTVRQRDGSFIHNIDSMLKNTGGNIVFRRWEGKKMAGGNSLYFVFATP